MLKAAGHDGDGQVLILGVDGENLTRLIAGEPMMVNAAEVGLPQMWVLLTGGTSVEQMAGDLRPAMTDPPRNKVEIEDSDAGVTGTGTYCGQPLLIVGITPDLARSMTADELVLAVEAGKMGMPVAKVTVLAGRTHVALAERLCRGAMAAMLRRAAAMAVRHPGSG